MISELLNTVCEVYMWRQESCVPERVIHELAKAFIPVAEVVIAYDQLSLLDSFECMSQRLGPIGQAKARNGL